ncbi:MAG: nucleotidyltransferase [Bacteroidales bacterium]|nr:nucleotidyltransferase [Bacteroidales bacterium]
MTHKKPTLLILAAGMGQRYGGLKQVDPVGPSGEAIIDYSIYDAIRAGFGKVVFVIRNHFAEAFTASFEPKLEGRIETRYVFQELEMIPPGTAIHPDRRKPWGTGHAVLVARKAIDEPFAVINADDFYGHHSFRLIHDHLRSLPRKDTNHYCMVSYRLDRTLSPHGKVSRGICETTPDGFLTAVTEHTHIERQDDGIVSLFGEGEATVFTGSEPVSMNIWGFQPGFFEELDTQFRGFIRTGAGEVKSEFYIPTVVNRLLTDGAIRLKVLESRDEWFGVTYREDREQAVHNIRALINAGVYPERLWT